MLFCALIHTKHALKCLQDLFPLFVASSQIHESQLCSLILKNNNKSGITEKIVLSTKAYWNFWWAEGLEYSVPFLEVTSHKALESPVLFWNFFPAAGGLCWESGFARPWPASVSFLRRFVIVGRTLVDKERSPGSCKQKRYHKSRK